jgi:saccharopine dehydrogenase-like NADP-dependent oxidoreductase
MGMGGCVVDPDPLDTSLTRLDDTTEPVAMATPVMAMAMATATLAMVLAMAMARRGLGRHGVLHHDRSVLRLPLDPQLRGIHGS